MSDLGPSAVCPVLVALNAKAVNLCFSRRTHFQHKLFVRPICAANSGKMKKISLSIVVTASHGIEVCPYLDEIRIAGDMAKTQIIVVDVSKGFEDQSLGSLLHLNYPNRGIQGLIREGIATSNGDWALITEDHCRPDADFVSKYNAPDGSKS